MTTSINTHEMQALTKWLKQVRETHQLSMRALAERMDKPHSYIQKVEQGERRLDVVEYVWYCRTLGVNPQVGLDLIHQAIAESKDGMSL
jgi:transcriptional regulator with XRE-family HTH domain